MNNKINLLLFVIVIGLLYFGLKYQVSQYNVVMESDSTYKINIPNKMSEELERLYRTNTNEFIRCITGFKVDDKIVFKEMYEPEIINNGKDFVDYIQCKNHYNLNPTIATIHSHPGGNCMLSKTDGKTYVGALTEGHLVTGIICGNTQYAFYKITSAPYQIVAN